uniref:Peptidase C1A papain C-terminal domain-containing protein n=1 Tax=Meloidogyne incognita TaxID=6306 RepID=A0A914MSV3_MELIC
MVRPVLCLGTSPRNLELKKFNLQEAWRPSEICLFLSRTTDKNPAGHAIRLIGYGIQTCSGKNPQPFWLAINSWGKGWGMNGVFMIAQGINECRIESWGADFGKPKV